MRYVEFRDTIHAALADHPDGLTWAELKAALDLPYKQPCPTWVNHLEQEIGLNRGRVPGRGRAYVWSVDEARG